MDSHFRQKFLNPLTLRAAQIFFDCTKSHPLITDIQKSKITPFFIIGSGRSGTTLLRSVLQRHSAINIPPESHSAIPNSVKKIHRYGGLDWKDLVSVIFGEFASQNAFSLWNIDLWEVQNKALGLSKEEKSLAKIIDLIYRHHIKVHKPEAVRWGDKTPFNTLRLKWVHKVFPYAKYVNMVRDGRDVIGSILKYNLASNLKEACRRWNLSLKNVEQLKKKNGQIKTIYYEELVNYPELVTKEICRFIDIPYENKMLENEPINLGDSHFKHHENIGEPITNKSVGKWKERLTDRQQRKVIKEIGKNLKKHGYIK